MSNAFTVRRSFSPQGMVIGTYPSFDSADKAARADRFSVTVEVEGEILASYCPLAGRKVYYDTCRMKGVEV